MNKSNALGINGEILCLWPSQAFNKPRMLCSVANTVSKKAHTPTQKSSNCWTWEPVFRLMNVCDSFLNVFI